MASNPVLKKNGTVPSDGDIVQFAQPLGVSNRYRIITVLGSYPTIRYLGVPLNDHDEIIGTVEEFEHGAIAQVFES